LHVTIDYSSSCASRFFALMDAPVRIGFRRTGGFAGLTMATDTATDQLPGSYEGLVRDLLAGSSPSTPADALGTPDRFTYDLHLNDGTRERIIRWPETAVPADVKPLIAELTSRSRPIP
jgi:hypothetical protein